jgi:hypothetical protein
MLAAAMLPGAVAAFTPGENGQPTSGNQTDLQGRAGDVTFLFQKNMTINCTDDNTTQQFNIQLDYTITGEPLPAGSVLVVYLSPNNGAIEGNAGGDEAGYISTVESNEISIDMSGLSGSGTLTFSIAVTSPFQLVSGGVLGVIANDVDGTAWTTKTNSINCGEELPTPTPEVTPTPTPEVTPTPTPEVTPTPTPEVTPTPTPEVTPTPTPEVTPTPTPEVTPTPTPEVTPTPTPEVTATPTPQVTPTPTGSIGAGATATPTAGRTLPPTDALSGDAKPAPDSWRLVLVAIAGILAAILVLTPARRRR